MNRVALRRGLRAICTAGVLAAVGASLLASAGCSSTGMHLPGGLWHKAGASTPANDESLTDATPYTPPPPTPRTADTVDSVVASVDGNPITLQDVATFGTAQVKSGSSAGGDAAQAAAPDDPNAKLKALITQQLIQEESQKYASKVDDTDVDR